MKLKIGIQKNHIAVLFSFLILLGGCKTQSEELKAMLASRISTFQPSTGNEVRRSYQDKGVTLGKPIPAEVIIEYKPIGNYTVGDVYDEIVKTLLHQHWQKEELSTYQPGFFIASLSQEGFIIKASVNIQPDRGIVSIRLRTFPR